jgi:hypothetical protein
MRKTQASLPLAFVLALAAEAGVVPALNEHATSLRAGSLSAFDQATGAVSDNERPHRTGIRDRIAQFFPNFKNCFSGSWRNC